MRGPAATRTIDPHSCGTPVPQAPCYDGIGGLRVARPRIVPDMDGSTPQSFGALLRRYRLAGGLSQEELAGRAGLSLQAVSALERGVRRAPHRDTVALLAQALALAPDQRATLEA